MRIHPWVLPLKWRGQGVLLSGRRSQGARLNLGDLKDRVLQGDSECGYKLFNKWYNGCGHRHIKTILKWDWNFNFQFFKHFMRYAWRGGCIVLRKWNLVFLYHEQFYTPFPPWHLWMQVVAATWQLTVGVSIKQGSYKEGNHTVLIFKFNWMNNNF